MSASLVVFRKFTHELTYETHPKISEATNNYEISGELFELTSLRIFFDFVEKKLTKRVENRVIGGVVTFGDAEPHVALYSGPTDEKSAKHAAKLCHSNDEGNSSRNASRGDTI